MGEKIVSFNPADPNDVGRAFTALADRVVELQYELDAHHKLLLALFSAFGENRHEKSVTHSEIEAALLSMRNAVAGSAYGESSKYLVECLLAIYRGEHVEDTGPLTRHLRLVRNPESEPPTEG